MKAKDVANQHQLDVAGFIAWLNGSGYKWSTSMGNVNIDDRQDMDEIAAAYKREIAAAQEMREGVVDVLITTGFSFDGYTIVKYSGVISADEVVEISSVSMGFWSGTKVTKPGEAFTVGLSHIRRNALARLKESAYALGCNAVIGVDFDYLSLDAPAIGSLPKSYIFGVTVSGNAVTIEGSGRLGSGAVG
ncbi:MAG: heavy metal-binding domain-containing protein [Actinomycetales bacterium]|nr:heavy metal-binding domain-containing protein [Actinomycetales bacterium]